MEFDDPEDIRYLGVYDGTVVDNADPEVLGRVRVMIPGLIEPSSAWAEPVGKAGGSAQRGEFAVPETGAVVTVQFLMGDPDRPKYQSGYWGKPGGKSEAPTYLQNVAARDAHLIHVVETKEYDIVMDSRSGKERLILRSKKNGTLISLKDGLIQLGEGATEKIVLGTSYRAAEDVMLDGLQQGFQAQLMASIGPFMPLVPGWMALISAIAGFKASAGANNSFLSDLARARQKWPP